MSASVASGFESAAGVEQVFRTLTDPSWAEQKAERLNDGSQVLQREERPDGGLVFVVSRALPDGVPGPLQRFLPSDGRVTQADDWGPETDGVRRGTWKVEIPGAPARMGGTLSLTPTPVGSRYAIQGTVTVKVPLVGGKAENYIAGLVRQLAAKEAELLGTVLGIEVQVVDVA